MLQTVKGRYLWLFLSFPLAYSVGMYVIYFLNGLQITNIRLSDIVVVMAFVPTLYYLLAYYIMVRQAGRAYALIIGLFITAIPISLGFALDGGYSSIQASISILLMFTAAMIGPVAILGLGWVHIIGYILVATGALGGEDTSNGVLFLLAYLGSGLGGWLVFHRNYTHDSQAVSAIRHTLHQEQLKSAALLAALDDGIVIVSPDGKVQFCSDVALGYLNLTRTTILHQSYDALFKHTIAPFNGARPTDPVGALKLTLHSKSSGAINLLTIQHDHRTLDLSASIRPVVNEDDEVGAYMLVLHDISSFSRAQRLKDDFISMAGHELRTPMTVIAGYADLLLNPRFGKLDKEQRKFVERTKQTTAKLIHFVNNMLDVTRLESGRHDNHPEILDVAEECKRVLAEFRPRFKQKHIHIDAHFSTGPLEANVDKARLHQVLGNLLSNAHTYAEEHGKVQVRIRAAGSDIEVSVTDDGQGISEENQRIIFNKFSRLSVDTSAEGTGLGLAIARQIVTAWGGIIDVDSDGKHGSRFYFTLPRHIEQHKKGQEKI